ncbi:ribonuclease E activity regulator RraA [Ensifer sp. ENS05]|uniref:ribonuclease E activity regulator RraA n=1 Tax=Ensifer sp. ENS05 TaxID=2769277 RepID=UPI0017846559|nr:ribonuclease E activity regulator RraA [Ensifer sp. ENS05]MBD9597328.1 ribonuclease E activity regulator RraA [Ensifer sp. ENS05]
MISFTSTPDLVDAFFEDAQIADAGLRDFGGVKKFWGEIQTVYCYEDSTHIAGSLDDDGHGKVLVVDAGASTRMALTGDQVLGRAIKNGWRGVVLNGCIRDVPLVREMEIGAVAIAPHPGKRFRRGDGKRNVPVNFFGVTFTPGDYIFCDETGVVVLPRAVARDNVEEVAASIG